MNINLVLIIDINSNPFYNGKYQNMVKGTKVSKTRLHS